MISIINKEDCCGCNACYSICAHRSITMQSDYEGFAYPVVDATTCTECGLCELVCPVINKSDSRFPICAYAAKSTDVEIRRQSSSGGVFTHLAEQVIAAGGVVFGAKFNSNWQVVHSFTEILSGLASFRGSKYVQSDIGDSYIQAKFFLNQGRVVLFSGTPCHIAGLKLFLRKEYSNLLTVDFICHGVPSPTVWNMYKQSILNLNLKTSQSPNQFTGITFRDKTDGWKQYRFVATKQSVERTDSYIELANKNIYMKGFLQDLYNRPSCSKCPSKNLTSNSDLTIADFWGIEQILPYFDDNKGVSLVLITTLIGAEAYRKLPLSSIAVEYRLATQSNQSLFMSAPGHNKRSLFFSLLEKKEIVGLIEKMLRPTLKQQLRLYAGRVFRMIFTRKK